MVDKSILHRIISKFYDIGTIRWKPSFPIAGKDDSVYYTEDTFYYGMPFSRRNWMFFDKFYERLHDGIYEKKKKKKKIPGVNCTGSLIDAVKPYIDIPDYYETLQLMVDYNLALPLGNDFGKITVDFLLNENRTNYFSPSTFYEAYSKLNLCDYLGTYFKKNEFGGWYGHVRFVTGLPFVKRTLFGNIDPEESYVIVSDNNVKFTDTNKRDNMGECCFNYHFNEKLTDLKSFIDLQNQKTHFILNKKISFLVLFIDLYFPFRFKIFL